jgi:predicted MPP superfamily phosphohydrolase
LSRALAAGTLSAGGAGILYGIWSAFEDPEVREVRVKLERLPAGSRGFSIVLLTDTHLAPWTPESFVRRLVERVNALKPDVIAVTGDLVDGNPDELDGIVPPLGNLAARHGVFFVTGNHEYYVDTHAWLGVIGKLGMKILNNSGMIVASSVYLAGIPDRTVRRLRGASPSDFPDARRALAGRPEDVPAVLLAHQPMEIGAAADAGADLQLSGHTHGGQIWPFGALVMAAQPYLSGLHRHGPAHIYVSRGAGTWGPPIRIAAPAEISNIILV